MCRCAIETSCTHPTTRPMMCLSGWCSQSCPAAYSTRSSPRLLSPCAVTQLQLGQHLVFYEVPQHATHVCDDTEQPQRLLQESPHASATRYALASWGLHVTSSTLVKMSVCGVFDARSWTLMARCTMGMSLSLMLNTTISAGTAGALCTGS
jgi:hypothetical protein